MVCVGSPHFETLISDPARRNVCAGITAITNDELIRRQLPLAKESKVYETSEPMTCGEEESSNLTIEQCEELATAITEDASLLPPASKKEELLRLALGYRRLAAMKRLIARKLI